MAFPWAQEETFDDGTRGAFDDETDAGGILDFPHYTELARHGLAPWRGAHALRLQLSGTAVANIQENDGFDTGVNETIHVWMPVLLPENLDIPEDEAIILFALQSTGPVNETVFGVRNNSGAYELFAGETGATRTIGVTRSNKKWHQVELTAHIDAGGGDDGTLDFFVDGTQVGAQITSLNQGAIIQAQLGAISGTAAGTTGTILIGGIIGDDARIFPRQRFFTDTVWVTRDITAFLGPVMLDSASVSGTSTDASLTIFDTDNFSATGIDFTREPKIFIRNVTANDQSPGFNTPIEFHRGVYAQLSGTNAQARISLTRPSAPVLTGANYISRGKAS